MNKTIRKIICLIKGHNLADVEEPIAWNDGNVVYEKLIVCLRCGVILGESDN